MDESVGIVFTPGDHELSATVGTLETFRAIVYPSQCDSMGHMNVQYYTAAFDQAMWHLVHALGYAPQWRIERHEGWADVRYVMNLRNELRAGDLVFARSFVVKIGRSSLVTAHELVNAATRAIAADAEVTSVYFDLQKRKSLAIPATIRAQAAQRVGVGKTAGTVE
jgi:acyl-CoA thioester hydrolase